MYEVETIEKRYINSEDASVTVSFQLPSHDWFELSRSSHWNAVENFLSQKKNTSNRRCHIRAKD